MSIPTDDTNTGPTDDDAVAALMSSMVPKAAPAEADDAEEGEGDDEGRPDPEDEDDGDEGRDDEDEDQDGEDEDEDGEEGDDAPAGEQKPTVEVNDDTKLTVVVDGEEQEVTVGSLKRLAGQEAALTRKSQEADVVGRRAAVVLQGSLETVLEDLDPYKDVDWVLESRRMEPEEFEWHRENFTKLQGRYQKIVTQAQALEANATAQRQLQLQHQAAEAVRVLSDPKTGIPGWSDQVYDDILAFAVEAGLPENEVAEITNPEVIKIINDARLYRQARKAAPEKVNLTPKRVKKGAGVEKIAAVPERTQKALEKKLQTGRATDDDAVAALMGRWGVKGR